METNKELVKLIQEALRLEHAAYLQYLSHAAIVRGVSAPGIIDQLEDNARDEANHARELRDILSNYLDVYPTTEVAETHKAIITDKIISTNLKDEQIAIKQYKTIMKLIQEDPDMENYHTIYEVIKDIIIEEEQHIAELKVFE